MHRVIELIIKNKSRSQPWTETGIKLGVLFYMVLIFLLMSSVASKATHIVGGEMTYTCMGKDIYEITLRIRRDCAGGDPEASFDDPASIGIFDQYGNRVIYLGMLGEIQVPFAGDDTITTQFDLECGFVGTEVCVHEAVYKTTIWLPDIDSDYIFAYERCCRNLTLNNIVNPLETGATYYIRIREESVELCNSGPEFSNWPDLYTCVGEQLSFDHSAIDLEGDSLVYKLCTPSAGASIDNPKPQPPNNPPFESVEWVEGYGTENFMGGEPLRIDSVTGAITAVPNSVGQYLIGICVEEYRDGVLLSTTRRDFEYNVGICFDPPEPDFEVGNGFCDSLSGNFINLSANADSYTWYFDYPNLDSSYISRDTSPGFTYQEPGVYTIRLEATGGIPGAECTKFIDKEIYVTNASLTADFTYTMLNCNQDSLVIQLLDQSEEIFEDASIVSWDWSIQYLNETILVAEQNPQIQIPFGQETTIILTVQSLTGCTDTISKTKVLDATFSNQIELELMDCSDTSFFVQLFDVTEYGDGVQAEQWNWSITVDSLAMNLVGDSVIVEVITGSQLSVSLMTILNNGCTTESSESFDFDLGPLLNIDVSFSQCDSDNGPATRLVNTASELFGRMLLSKTWTIQSAIDTIILEGDTIDYQPGAADTFNVTLSLDYGDNCMLEQSQTISASNLVDGEVKFVYSIDSCSSSGITLSLTDLSEDLINNYGLLSREWSIMNDSILFAGQDSTFSVELPSVDSFKINLTLYLENGCSFDSSQMVMIDLVSVEFKDSPIIVCDGSSSPLVENPDSSWTYIWSPEEGLSFQDSTDKSDPVAQPNESTLYHVTVTNGECFAFDSILVMRAEDITLQISSDQDVCDSMANLVVSGAGDLAQYEWSNDSLFSEIIGQENELNYVLDSQIDTVYSRAVLNGCTIGPVSIILENRSVALELFDSLVVVCEGFGARLVEFPDSNLTYVWTPETGLSFEDESDKSNPLALPDSSTTYSVMVTNGECVDSASIEVLRIEDVNLNIQGEVDECDSLATLSVSGAGDSALYEWSFDSLFTNIVVTGKQVQIEMPGISTRIYVRAVVNNCISQLTFIDVESNFVSIQFVDQPVIVCPGNPSPLIANPDSSWTYIWSPEEGLNFEDPEDKSNPLALPDSTQLYKVTVTNGACMAVDSITVIVSTVMNLQFHGSTVICNDQVSLSVEGAEPGTYVWSTNAMLSDTIIVGDSLNIIQLENEMDYYVQGSFVNGCTSRVEHLTVTSGDVNVELPFGEVLVCEGNPSQLVLNPNSEWTYTWEPEDGLIFEDENDKSNPLALPDQSTTYSVTVTNGFCESFGTVDVIRTEEINIEVSGDTTSCDGNYLLFIPIAEVGARYEWSDNADFEEILYTGTVFQAQSVQMTDTFYVRAMSLDCELGRSSVIVQNLTPVIEFVDDSVVVCDNNGVQLLVNPDSNYTYLWEPEDGLVFENEENKFNPTALPEQTTTYHLTVTYEECEYVDSIKVQKIEDISIQVHLDSLDCDGTAFVSVADSVPNAEYQWSKDSTFSEIIAAGVQAIISVEEVDTIYARYFIGNCFSGFDSIVINREVVSIQFITDPIILCTGIPAKIVANPNENWSYTWSPTEGLDFSDGQSNPSVLTDVSVEYTVTVSDGMCEDVQSILVIPTESIQVLINGDVNSCTGITNLTAESMGTLPIVWSQTPDFNSILDTTYTLQIPFEGDFQTFYARALMLGTECESDLDSFVVTNTEINLTSDPVYEMCFGDVLEIELVNQDSAQNIDIIWEADPRIISPLDALAIEVLSQPDDESFVLIYHASNQFSCLASDSVLVNSGVRVEVPAVTFETVCGEYTVCFSSDAAEGSILWDFGDPDNDGDQSTDVAPCYTYSQAGMYVISLQSAAALCGFEAFGWQVSVPEILSIEAASPEVEYCTDGSATLTAQTNGDPSLIRWLDQNGDSLGTGPSIEITPDGDTLAMAFIVDDKGCSDSTMVQLRNYMFDLEVMEFDPFCAGESMIIEVIDNTGDSLAYSWAPEDCIFSDGDTNRPTVWATESKELTLTVTNLVNQCIEEIVVPLEISEIDVALQSDPDTMINLSESVEITANTESATEIGYMWSTGADTPSINVTPEETTTYTVIVTDEFGCSASAQVEIEVRQPLCNETDVFLPTAFTPNGDGVNDVLFVRSNFVESMLLVIYNRWGEEVFRSADVNTGWNGRYMNTGEELAPDAFAYSLSVVCINDLEYTSAGNVTLLR